GDVVVPVHFAGTAISEVGAEAGAGGNDAVDFGIAGVGVAEGNGDILAGELGGEFVAAVPFGSDGNETDVSVGGGLEAVEFGEIGGFHFLARVGSAKSRFRAE